MEVRKLEIEGLKVIAPKVFFDDRGYFFESFSQKVFDEEVSQTVFVQDNQSKSTKGVARGLHFQLPPYAQAKLVRCVAGEVLDIALDIRKGSPTYGKLATVRLSAENNLQFFLPHGFAHGFVVLSETAIFQYKCDNYYAPGFEGGVSLLDKSLDIDFVTPADEIVLSVKDKRYPCLADFDSPFVLGVNC